ncbi:hypothetical protein TPA0906_00260 [Streptomyces olivaceus]|uniref:hypothetical protein n=1 Tax=Streptomyces olivaceus TaxID=47716 RepID=UPI0022EFC5C7|nr:hypothetical protein [Streptomyces olivaceus]GHI98160.1 hypothetical protein TPA0906_00260 [Streptomyces olivaceus]
MNRILKTTLALAASATVLAGTAVAASPAAATTAPAAAAAASCTIKWKVTGGKVAVRKPKGNAPVASPNSPVVRYLHRGDVVTSCVEAIARTQSGPAYRKCGRGGHVWRIVKGGQVPATCLKRL